MKKWIVLLLLLIAIPTVSFAEFEGWTPCANSTVTMTVTDSSGTTRTDLSHTCGNSVMLSNTGSEEAFCEVTTSAATATPTATTADTVVLAGSYKIIRVPKRPQGDRKVACIAASGESTTVYVEVGEGGLH